MCFRACPFHFVYIVFVGLSELKERLSGKRRKEIDMIKCEVPQSVKSIVTGTAL